jgi:hypothetical protein
VLDRWFLHRHELALNATVQVTPPTDCAGGHPAGLVE